GPVSAHGPPKFHLPESGSVDFWAVGMDCCNQTSGEFWCGQVSNPRARAGMRMLRDDSRPFYALAVQVWAAKRCPEDVNTVSGVRAQAPWGSGAAPSGSGRAGRGPPSGGDATEHSVHGSRGPPHLPACEAPALLLLGGRPDAGGGYVRCEVVGS
ncbi:unnamed protein product, partial [Prorocentrum cordatum]